MPEIEIHQRESDDNTESFLQENIDKLRSDLMIIFRAMRLGRRLTGKTVVQEFNLHDRRLRDLYAEREYIKRKTGWEIKKEWKLNEKGKREYVEYFAVAPKIYPTKSALQQWWDDFQNEKPQEKFYQSTFSF